MFLGCPHDVVVDEAVVAQKGEFVLHVFEEASDEGGEVDDVRRLVLVKDGHRLLEVSARRVSVGQLGQGEQTGSRRGESLWERTGGRRLSS